MSQSVRRFVIAALCGSAVAVVAASVLAPSVFHMLFTPPVSFGTHCEPSVDWALRNFRNTQLVGLIVGAVAGPVLAALVRKRFLGNKASSRAPTAS